MLVFDIELLDTMIPRRSVFFSWLMVTSSASLRPVARIPVFQDIEPDVAVAGPAAPDTTLIRGVADRRTRCIPCSTRLPLEGRLVLVLTLTCSG